MVFRKVRDEIVRRGSLPLFEDKKNCIVRFVYSSEVQHAVQKFVYVRETTPKEEELTMATTSRLPVPGAWNQFKKKSHSIVHFRDYSSAMAIEIPKLDLPDIYQHASARCSMDANRRRASLAESTLHRSETFRRSSDKLKASTKVTGNRRQATEAKRKAAKKQPQQKRTSDLKLPLIGDMNSNRVGYMKQK